MVYDEMIQDLGTTSGGAADFDFYIFAQSWQAEFCAHRHFPGCRVPQEYWKHHFTIHGLWPERTSGAYPASCSGPALNATSLRETFGLSTLTKYWPDVKVRAPAWTSDDEDDDDNRDVEPPVQDDYDEFWSHEWAKHGTCSGLNQTSYFRRTLALGERQNATPALIIQAAASAGPVELTTASVREAYGGSDQVVLKCASGAYLMQVFTCWTRDSVTKRMACPEHVLAEDTCGVHETVLLATFH